LGCHRSLRRQAPRFASTSCFTSHGDRPKLPADADGTFRSVTWAAECVTGARRFAWQVSREQTLGHEQAGVLVGKTLLDASPRNLLPYPKRVRSQSKFISMKQGEQGEPSECVSTAAGPQHSGFRCDGGQRPVQQHWSRSNLLEEPLVGRMCHYLLAALLPGAMQGGRQFELATCCERERCTGGACFL